MKEQDFDSLIREALIPTDARNQLADAIDRRIQRHGRVSAARRRLTLATASIAAVFALAFFFTPSAAEAALRQMAGALDGVDRMQMVTYSVTEEGKLVPSRTVSYDHAKWRFESTSGSDVSLWKDGKSLVLMPQQRCYVLAKSPEGPMKFNPKSMKLSDLLGFEQSGKDSIRVNRALLDGQQVIRATVDVSYMNERHVFFADPETQLPIEMHAFSKELGTWKLKARIICNYAPRFAKGFFDADPNIPVVSKEEFEQKLVAGLTSDDLGHLPLAKGRLVIRAFEVSSDGTVFVAYQSGAWRANSWWGLALAVSDDQGTQYARPIEIFGALDEQFIERSEDGKMEMEVFVPLEPALPWKPREIKVGAHVSPNGDLIRFIRVGINHPDRTATYRIMPNTSGTAPDPGGKDAGRPTYLLTRKLQTPTCREAPAFASIVSNSFGNDFQARMYKARVRARQYQESGDWANAERRILEMLRLKREQEAQGYGSWSTNEDLENLQAVRAKLNKP